MCPCRNKDASPGRALNKGEGAIKSAGSEVRVAVKRFPGKGGREKGSLWERDWEGNKFIHSSQAYGAGTGGSSFIGLTVGFDYPNQCQNNPHPTCHHCDHPFGHCDPHCHHHHHSDHPHSHHHWHHVDPHHHHVDPHCDKKCWGMSTLPPPPSKPSTMKCVTTWNQQIHLIFNADDDQSYWWWPIRLMINSRRWHYI